MKQWDAFLSHASEDKNTVAAPLSEALRRCGVRVWLDRFQINIGDSIRQKIDEGLANSCYGVVILSETFFSKLWAGRELDALFARDVVLPVWHGIDEKTVLKYSPLLAGKLAVSTSAGIEIVAEKLASRIFKPILGAPDSAGQVAHAFACLLGQGSKEQLVAFVAEHPRILARALGVPLDAGDVFRSLVQLGPHTVDFCTATYQPSTGRFSDWQFVVFGPATVPLYNAALEMHPEVSASIEHATRIASWLASNLSAGRQALRDIGPSVQMRIVAGRRPQPGSPSAEALQNLNEELARMQLRTYDWLLDSALMLAGEGDD
jgi:hypothetical protein